MRILLLADIHIGAIRDPNYVYQTMVNIIEKEIIFQHTDAVILLGDYFDRLFKANEENTSLAINVMSYLVRACRRERTKIRILYGTEGHEMSQYRLFNYHMSSKKIDMKIFYTVTEEELFPGVPVLYIPEEYVSSKEEQYRDTLYGKKRYRYIFGHGVIIEGMSNILSNISPYNSSVRSKEKQVPQFKSEELSGVADQVVFGHYHIHTDITDRVHYLGSLFRWKFGEEDPKGYGILEDDTFTFVDNPSAWLYRTYDYPPEHPIYRSEETLEREIERIQSENADLFGESFVGKIRMRFTVPNDLDLTFRDRLNAIIGNEPKIRALFTNLNDRLIEEVKRLIQEDTEYEYLLDPNLTIYNKIHHFLLDDASEQSENDTIPALEKIKEYCEHALTHA